jgi:hypothetical protein
MTSGQRMTSLKAMAAAPTSYRCLTRHGSPVGGLPQGTRLGTSLDDSRTPLTDTMPSRWLAARGSLARRRDCDASCDETGGNEGAGSVHEPVRRGHRLPRLPRCRRRHGARPPRFIPIRLHHALRPDLLLGASFTMIGRLVSKRRSEDPICWLFLAMGGAVPPAAARRLPERTCRLQTVGLACVGGLVFSALFALSEIFLDAPRPFVVARSWHADVTEIRSDGRSSR